MIRFDDVGPEVQELLGRMTEQEKDFVRLFMATGNATDSYRKAVGEPDTDKAKKSGFAWKNRKDMKTVLEELRLISAKRFEVSESNILKAYAELAFGDIRGFYNEDGKLLPITELPRNLANMVTSFEQEDINVGSGESRQTIGTLTKVRLINRREALDSLSRTQGMFITEKKKTEDKAKVVRFPAQMSKDEWQKQHSH